MCVKMMYITKLHLFKMYSSVKQQRSALQNHNYFCTNLIRARNQSSGSCEGGGRGADGRSSGEEPSGWWNVPDLERFLGFTMCATCQNQQTGLQTFAFFWMQTTPQFKIILLIIRLLNSLSKHLESFVMRSSCSDLQVRIANLPLFHIGSHRSLARFRVEVSSFFFPCFLWNPRHVFTDKNSQNLCSIGSRPVVLCTFHLCASSPRSSLFFLDHFSSSRPAQRPPAHSPAHWGTLPAAEVTRLSPSGARPWCCGWGRARKLCPTRREISLPLWLSRLLRQGPTGARPGPGPEHEPPQVPGVALPGPHTLPPRQIGAPGKCPAEWQVGWQVKWWEDVRTDPGMSAGWGEPTGCLSPEEPRGVWAMQAVTGGVRI